MSPFETLRLRAEADVAARIDPNKPQSRRPSWPPPLVTGRDNRTTQWSVNAIEKYTGISRPNAKKAVKDLLNHGVWKKLRDGRHPIYEAVCGNRLPAGPFTVDEQAAIAAIREGKAVPHESKAAIKALVARGIAKKTPHEDENIRNVARSNAVRLARCIPWAAGFKSVLIATGDGGGGYSDIEDGSLPEQFTGNKRNDIR